MMMVNIPKAKEYRSLPDMRRAFTIFLKNGYNYFLVNYSPLLDVYSMSAGKYDDEQKILYPYSLRNFTPIRSWRGLTINEIAYLERKMTWMTWKKLMKNS